MLKVSPRKVAYKLELPKELSNIHNTFQVSNLKKCLSDESLIIPIKELQLNDKLIFVEEPVEVMDREIKQLKRSPIPIVKVRWNSKRGPETSDFPRDNATDADITKFMSSSPRSTITSSEFDMEKAFSFMNVHNYTSASSATSGRTSFKSSEDSRNESLIPPPDPITPPAILTPSPILSPSLLFDPRISLMPPKRMSTSEAPVLTHATIEKLVAHSVATVLEAKQQLWASKICSGGNSFCLSIGIEEAIRSPG
ncbi:hypothetical protein Tco_0870571 [Tanacetum coccineum]